MKRLFQQVDVFTSTPYLGNPVAVVLEGAELSVDQMQRFANWTNLSETTFVLSPTSPLADYRIRIFTPSERFPRDDLTGYAFPCRSGTDTRITNGEPVGSTFPRHLGKS